jgi:hypothetical protein
VRVEPATWVGWERLKDAGCDAYGGYSLGAWLLLRAAQRGEIATADVWLCAPFVAFPEEAGLGGRVKRSQLGQVRRWLRTDPGGALADFSRRASLDLPLAAPADISALDEGLAWLSSTELASSPGTTRCWRAVIGDNDALLSAESVKDWPGAMIVPGAGHAFAPLLEAASGRRFAGGRP